MTFADTEVATGSEAYTAASDIEAYRAANLRLVTMANVESGALVADVGCGPGIMLELLLEHADPGACWGIDPDQVMVAEARRRLGRAPGLLVGSVENVDELVPDQSLDVVFLANTIHMLEDPVEALVRVRRVLRAGGRVAFNSGFFKGAAASGSEALFLRLLLIARRIARESGQTAAKAARGKAARRELTADYLVDAVVRSGFEATAVEQHDISLPVPYLLALAATPMLAWSVLPGVPMELAPVIMRQAAEQLVEELGVDTTATLERTFLYVVGTNFG